MRLRLSVSLALATGAAYAFSFAADLLIGALIGVYPSTAYLPVITWLAISAIGLFAAQAIRANPWLALPYFALGTLATLVGAVGAHRYNLAVAGLMFLHAYLLRRVWHRKSSLLSASQVPDSPEAESRNEEASVIGRTRASFAIGDYKLDTPVHEIGEMREFSPIEYAIMGLRFEGEKNYNAPSLDFLGRRWKLMLGTVNGRIYKIAPYLDPRSKEDADPIATETLHYCTDMLGPPTSKETALVIWDTTDGNVILQTTELAGEVAISLFVTSRAVRTFKLRLNAFSHEPPGIGR